MTSLDQVVDQAGETRARFLIYKLLKRARQLQIGLPPLTQTRYINTISPEQEPNFPGDEAMELRIRRIVRWNAMAMVLRANSRFTGIGGHLSTYASSASLYETGFNHFFRGKDGDGAGDQIFYQGHAAPGIYARAFLEGRLTEDQLDHFRRETVPGESGLSSYPHPRLMPDLWEFPTVSMGLGPISAIYQARFNRYLQNRGLIDTSKSRVWAFLGDGETDEPESLGALHVAAREGLDNLTFVVNCNLQRLDGPVRGNGKIIQELESVFRGSGWNVIKVIWAREWDDLLARDVDGVLVQQMNETLDGEFQKFTVAGGAYIREHFFGPDPRLRKLVDHLSDDDLAKLRRGGHDYRKLFAAYKAATEFKGAPTVILAKTVKGWTLGPAVEARNMTHQAKKLSENELRVFRDRLQLPIPDAHLADAPYYHPGAKSEEVEYLHERRRALGGPIPKRVVRNAPLPSPKAAIDAEFQAGSQTAVSTTMVFTRILRNLIRDKELGPRIVPIIPDEARTFGMDPLFKEVGIYAALGQRYDPVDSDLVLSYREATDGQVLEEGITEAGSMASFQAAGTSYASHGLAMIPFYIFYSMFGFQRTGDQMWAFADARGRGFLMGATAGRTTLTGEGLQHDDGHSQVLASTVPNAQGYDPAFAYELAAIVRDGIERMYVKGEDVFYYISLYNENYPQPAKPDGVDEGILRGIYRFAEAPALGRGAHPARLVGSGAILNQSLAARDLLAEKFGVAAEVYSAPSFPLLRRDALQAERWNRLHPSAVDQRVPYVSQVLAPSGGPIIAATDWMKSVPDMVSRWLPSDYIALGTDGFGRSDTRENLRALFEINPAHIAAATIVALARCGALSSSKAAKAIKELGIDPDKTDPLSL
ncbi:MAG: pyruvate dehydrogenase (acetyl-transferring), homodimeric type, partial [Chloroflexi bacterium]|nr:pyruvate dehydrogenase (acetyl-transferring), homodimeric type [Chloroflexota bacterium]